MSSGTNRRRGRLSNKSQEIALAPIVSNNELNRKVALATECFTTSKASELILKDRTRLSEKNALTVCNYIIAFKHEVNPRPSYIKHTIQFLAELSKAVGTNKRFEDLTKEDVLLFFGIYIPTTSRVEIDSRSQGSALADSFTNMVKRGLSHSQSLVII